MMMKLVTLIFEVIGMLGSVLLLALSRGAVSPLHVLCATLIVQIVVVQRARVNENQMRALINEIRLARGVTALKEDEEV